MADVLIYELSKGWDVWCWLCALCLKARKRAGWLVKTKKKPPHPIACQDCPRDPVNTGKP